MLNAGISHLAAPIQHILDRHLIRREMGCIRSGALDGVVISPNLITGSFDGIEPLTNDIQSGAWEVIAGIAILGDKARGFVFAHAANHDRWMWLRERLRHAQGFSELIVLAIVRAIV